MAPLIPQNIIDPAWNNLIAVLIGMAFGFILESSGFSSSRKLAGVFYGYDFVVLKVFFTGALSAAIGLYVLSYAGLLDMTEVYVNPTFVNSAIIGGIIMGVGFITGGFCPGTSYCGAAIGKIDAMVFSVSMLVGILLFSLIFNGLEKLFEANELGPVTVYEVLGISPGLFLAIFICIALGAFIFTGYLNKRIKKVDY
jgi:hypothetical protein